MKVLLVEDEDTSREDTLAVLADMDDSCEVAVAGSRDEAIAYLEEHEYDLVICDLKIPPDPGSLGSDEGHGIAVHAFARGVCPGTPLIFLTGKATDRNLRNQLSSGGIGDYYGLVTQPLVQLAIKDITGEEVPLIKKMVVGLRSLGDCTIHGVDGLDEMLVRAVQMYGKRIGAVEADFDAYHGYSGARVGRATFRLRSGQSRLVLVKVLPLADAMDEQRRYEDNVPTKLDIGYYVPSVTPAFHGLRKSAALYYAFASDAASFFSLCASDPVAAAAVVERMASRHRPWTDETWQEEISVGELRRRRVKDGDGRAAALWSTDWYEDLERRRVSLDTCTSHGDLHGDNVLVGGNRQPTLIDFGDVGSHSTALDPVTLELSLFFYESGPGVKAPWCSVERLAHWTDLEPFTSDLPLAPVVRACRKWANAVASEETIRATAYAHAIRQLKFGHVEAEKALAVARSAVEPWLARG